LNAGPVRWIFRKQAGCNVAAPRKHKIKYEQDIGLNEVLISINLLCTQNSVYTSIRIIKQILLDTYSSIEELEMEITEYVL